MSKQNSVSDSRSSASLLIRAGKIEDVDNIISGINEICKEGGAFYISHFQPSLQWQKILYQSQKASNYLLLVAEWEGRFAGIIRLFPGEDHTLYQHVASLGMFVLKPYRRLGIGTILMERALFWANTRFEKVWLSVFETNLPAIRLYQQFGFEQEGCLVKQIKSGEQYINLWLMGRILPT